MNRRRDRARRALRLLAPGVLAAVVWAAPVTAGASSAAAGGAAGNAHHPSDSCEWPMFGHDPSRAFATACASAPTTATVATLVPRWFVHAHDAVTASPTVAGGVAYVGAWDGTFYAVDMATGKVRWSTVLGNNLAGRWHDGHHDDYGQITSSAAVATVGGRPVVFVGAAGSMYALDASPTLGPGAQRILWRADVDPAHPTGHGEVESSPVVWADHPGGPVVIFGADSNQSSAFVGEGMWAVDALTGTVLWHFNPETWTHHALYGCGNVWSSPALDVDPTQTDPSLRALLVFGTADCPDNTPSGGTSLGPIGLPIGGRAVGGAPCPADGSDAYCPPGSTYDYSKRWQPYSEAIIAVDAQTGSPVWSYQGHPPLSVDDDDYGSSAQFFTLPGVGRVVGEAGKDGMYTVLTRNGAPAAPATATDVAGAPPRSAQSLWHRPETGNGNVQQGFAVGGFIGNTAVGGSGHDVTVFGGSAINTPVTYDAAGNPVVRNDLADMTQPMRAFAAADGSSTWAATQAPTYGATSYARGVVYNGAVDDMLRAYDAATGRLLWSFPLSGPISSGPAVAEGMVVSGAGTTESDIEFKACDPFPPSLAARCRLLPQDGTVSPLSRLNGIWAFAPVLPSAGSPAPADAATGDGGSRGWDGDLPRALRQPGTLRDR